MKTLLFFLFLLSTLQANAQTNPPREVEVFWVISWGDVDSLSDFPEDLLKAFELSQLKAYDTSFQEMSIADVKQRVILGMREPILTDVEQEIIMANSDGNDFIKAGEKPYSRKEIMRWVDKGESEAALEKLSYHPLQVIGLGFEVHEKVQMNTSLYRQKGNIEYIRLIMPSSIYNTQGSVLCQFKYEDVEKLNLMAFNVIKNHSFTKYSSNRELRIIEKGKLYELYPSEYLSIHDMPREQLMGTPFVYFTEDIYIPRRVGPPLAPKIMEETLDVIQLDEYQLQQRSAEE